MTQEKKPVLIFELGHLQVFSYQTIEEWTTHVEPDNFFWKKKDAAIINGPFKTLFEAVQNYTDTIKPMERLPENVIEVDFKLKRRKDAQTSKA